MKTIAIYHKDCTDGTTAAAVVLRKYPEALVFPLGHGFKPEEIAPIIAQATPGDRILTVDGIIAAREFLAAGFDVISIDHHASVEKEYTELAQKNKHFTFIFDIKKSGASLTWSYLFPNEPVPELVKLVEDFDLWNWRFSPDTNNVAGRLWMITNNPQETLRIMNGPLDEIKKEGAAIAAYSAVTVTKTVESAEPLQFKTGNFIVPVYNITTMKSEIGNVLSRQLKTVVGLYTIHGHEVRFSFRSLDEHTPSALDIATTLGGGGHRNAAGAKIGLEQFFKSIL